jgi:signal transduction histidine kinase
MTEFSARWEAFVENKVWRKTSSKMLVIGITVGFIGAAFLVSELMYYLLVPDLGRHGERIMAEGVSALIIGGLAAALFRIIIERKQVTVARLQVISEMNHHIRNALTAISLSAHLIPNQQSVRVIQESVERIEWALREILPRERPVPDQQRQNLFQLGWKKGNG